jgi:hypothetical protein
VSKLAAQIKVDKFAPVSNDGKLDETRPDLVFLMSDPVLLGPFIINVVELKSPSLALTIDHYRQLDEYIFKVREWCKTELHYDVAVHGFLIGAMPAHDTRAISQKMLLEQFRKSTPSDSIKILGLTQLIKDAMTVHLEAIKSLEQELNENEDDIEKAPIETTN